MRKSKLKNYVIIEHGNEKCLYGEVYGDARFVDGHHILTSDIDKLKDNIAITKNKTEYTLENEITKEEFEKLIREEYTDNTHIDYLLRPLYDKNYFKEEE